MALTTLSAVKTHLGTTGTTKDAFLTQLLSAVESAFLHQVERVIEETTATIYLNGNNSRVLPLPEYPVSAVSDVRVDNAGYWGTASGSFASTTALTSGVDYALILEGSDGTAQVGRLWKINGVWPARWERKSGLLTAQLRPGAGNIRVSLTHGYNPVPDDIQLAIWQIVAQIQSERATGRPAQAESFEDYSISWMADAANQAWRTGSAAQIVARYKRLTPRYDVMG